MAKFEIGDWCIDTKSHRAVDIIAIIPAGHNSMIDLYVVEPSDGGYYILSETDLTEYNKYYWDDLPSKET
jgi:hypothetical protein